MDFKKFYIYIILFFVLYQVSFTQVHKLDDKLLQIKDYLEQYNSYEKPGISVAIVYKGKAIHTSTHGMSDLENNLSLHSNSVFDLASVAKPFTGIAMSMLVENKVISTEDDIRKYLPELPSFKYKITVGNLLHHSSGLRDWVSALTLAGRTENDVITDYHIWNVIHHMNELNFVPGTKFSYSNTNYFLLAEIIERATNTPFEKWMDDNLFIPLKMEKSFILKNSQKIIPNRVQSYYLQNKQYLKLSNQLVSRGSSSMFSNARDFSNLLIDLQTHEVIKKSVYDRLKKCETYKNGEVGFYGYGFENRTFHEYEYLTHGGWWQGYRSKFVHFPNEELSMVVLTNCFDIRPELVVTELIKIILEINPKPIKLPEEPEISKGILMDTLQFDQFAGKYQLLNSNHPIVYSVWREGENYFMQCSGGYPVNKAIPISDSSFYVIPEHEYIIFNKSHIDLRNLTIRKLNNEKSHWQKVSFIRFQDDLDNYCGVYYCDELKTTYQISHSNGNLVAFHFHNKNVTLKQVLTNSFNSDKWWFERIEFIRNMNNKITGFILDCDHERINNLKFKKVN